MIFSTLRRLLRTDENALPLHSLYEVWILSDGAPPEMPPHIRVISKRDKLALKFRIDDGTLISDALSTPSHESPSNNPKTILIETKVKEWLSQQYGTNEYGCTNRHMSEIIYQQSLIDHGSSIHKTCAQALV